MAGEKMTYELTLRTSATGKGAAETKAGLEGVDAAAKKVAASSAQVAASGRSMEQFLRDTANQARPAEIAFYDLDARLARTANTAEALPASLAKVGAGTKNVGMIATQAGYQVQDFFVQVGAGQSTLTAFAQQAPQFLSIFGPAGAIAGAVVAIGAVGASIFSKMGDDAGSAADKVAKAQETWEKLGESVKGNTLEDIRNASKAVDDAAASQERLRQKFPETKAANNEYALAVIENARKEIEARRILDELLGKQIDKFKELRELQSLDNASSAKKTDQAIQAENQKRLDAEEAVADAWEKKNNVDNEFHSSDDNLGRSREELANDRKTRDALEKRAAQKRGWTAAHSTPGLPWGPTEDAKEAQKQLDQTVLPKIAMLDKKIEALEQALEGPDAELLERQNRANLALEEAIKKRADITAGTETQIRKLQEQQAADERLNGNAQAEQQNDLLAGEIGGAISKVDTSKAQSDEMRKALSEAAAGLDATKADEKALRDKIIQTVNSSSSTLAELEGLQGDIERAAAAVDTSKAAGRQAQQRLTEVAKGLDENVSEAEKVKQSILKAVEDGKITVKEQQQLGKDLSAMMGLIQSHQVEVNGNITLLVAMFRAFQAENANLRKSIETLQNPQ